jgi:hypothetical protein
MKQPTILNHEIVFIVNLLTLLSIKSFKILFQLLFIKVLDLPKLLQESR